jgi:hypothetical protein
VPLRIGIIAYFNKIKIKSFADDKASVRDKMLLAATKATFKVFLNFFVLVYFVSSLDFL